MILHYRVKKKKMVKRKDENSYAAPKAEATIMMWRKSPQLVETTRIIQEANIPTKSKDSREILVVDFDCSLFCVEFKKRSTKLESAKGKILTT